MGDLINLVRPDGSILQATEEDAAQLRAYGYKDQTLEAQAVGNINTAKEDYYTTPGQKVKTAIEGLASGMTLGLSDKLLEYTTDAGITGDEWRSRSKYNPGTRLAFELVGAIAPSVMSGGSLTPAGALTEGAKVATKGIGGAVTRSVARGAIEGAGFGLGAEISHSAITGDPMTVEGTLAGMGWGALWGGGLSVLPGVAEGHLAKKAAVRAEAEAATKLVDETYGAFRGAVTEAGAKAEGAFKAAGESLEVTGGRAEAAMSEATSIRKTQFNAPWTEEITRAKEQKVAAIEAYKDMKAALAKKDWGAFEGASTAFEDRVAAINDIAQEYGYAGAEKISPFKAFRQLTTDGTTDALNQIKSLGAVSSELKKISQTPSGFLTMKQGKFEKMAGALEEFLAHPAAELKGTQEAINSTIAKMAEQAGVKTEGNAVAQLRGIWENARGAKSASGVSEAQKLAERRSKAFNPAREAAMGVALSKGIGGGWGTYMLGRSLARGLLGLKGAVFGTIKDGASKWAPRAGKAVRYLAPQGEPLMTRLDGTIDLRDKHKTADQLMLDRAKEIREAAPTIRDTIYKNLAPISALYPEYAAALHEQAIAQFTYLYNKLPRDPGNAFNRLESLYKPDPVETAKFGRYYEIFQNPVKAYTDMLQGRRVSPEAAEALSNMWPALFQTGRMALIQRFSDPAVLGKMQYDDQVQMSLLTGLRMHSTLRPEFIASQQQMYTQRQTPLPMAAQPGAPGGQGGRPSGESPYMTQAQESTLR